jgi:hypothetical protein
LRILFDVAYGTTFFTTPLFFSTTLLIIRHDERLIRHSDKPKFNLLGVYSFNVGTISVLNDTPFCPLARSPDDTLPPLYEYWSLRAQAIYEAAMPLGDV